MQKVKYVFLRPILSDIDPFAVEQADLACRLRRCIDPCRHVRSSCSSRTAVARRAALASLISADGRARNRRRSPPTVTFRPARAA